MQKIYELDNVTKKYGKIIALESLGISIGEGPVSVLGYSGAGKTTLLKLLAGLEMPSTGTMRFRDEEVARKDLRNLRRNVTMLFQDPTFFDRSVLENVTFGLTIRGVGGKEAAEIAKETFATLGLAGFENRKAMKLSGGEQQRVALARALVLDPEVLLLDEPTSNLDPANAKVILEVLSKFSKKGLVIISTHNLLHTRKLARYSIYLEKGKIVETGPTDILMHDPKMEGTKRFINGLL